MALNVHCGTSTHPIVTYILLRATTFQVGHLRYCERATHKKATIAHATLEHSSSSSYLDSTPANL